MDKIHELQNFEMQNVRRTALVVKAKKPFHDWILRNDPTTTFVDDIDSDVYLLPDYEEVAQMDKWLKKNFDRIFCEQLFGWYTDESMWIQNRTFKMFTEWFDYSMHTMVWDLVDGPIEKLN